MPSSLQKGISVLCTRQTNCDGSHDPELKATYWNHVCLVPFWITVAEEDEYREEDVDSKLEYL